MKPLCLSVLFVLVLAACCFDSAAAQEQTPEAYSLLGAPLYPIEIATAEKAKLDSNLDIATQGYGVGNWYFYNGQTEKAKEIFEKVIKGKYWAAFGYIAAETEWQKR